MATFRKIFSGIGKILDRFRKTLHFLFLLFFFLVLLGALSPTPKPRVVSGSALLLNPTGPIVDQLSGDPLQRSFDQLTGNYAPQTLTRDVLRAIKGARNDSRISVIVMDVHKMAGGGLTKLQLIADALEEFKASGKKVISYGDFYTQGQYMLAAHADEVYLHPSGFIYIDGFGRFRRYYKEAIDKLSIDWNVFKVGEFKSFVEPYLRNDMSPEDRSSSMVWMTQLWNSYSDDVDAARGIETGTVKNYANNIRQLVEASSGDLAKPALSLGLVDELLTRDQFEARVLKSVEKDPESKQFRRIDLSDYVATLNTADKKSSEQQVGVVVASGEILDGTHPPGVIGGDSLASLLREARENKKLDALVLYIDSPGGSKFASEVIQRELLLWKESKRPLVTVMSSVAASGGYWLAMDGDEIWASPTTITGSIGIGGYIPTFQRSLARLGVNVDGVGTTRMSGTARIDRELGADFKSIMQNTMQHGYQQFIGSVAAARNMTVDEVDKIARGRVWSGMDAQRIGLVDRMGTLKDGIASAANMAGLGDAYEVKYLERELSFEEQVTMMFSTRVHAWTDNVQARSTRLSFTEVMQRLDIFDLEGEIARLTSFNDPMHLYMHCFCRVD